MIYLINNKFITAKKATLPISSDALRGYGLFETLRGYNSDEFFMATEHVQRLLKSAKHIDLKIKFNQNQILKMMKKIANKNKHKNKVVRIMAVPDKLIITVDKLIINPKIYEGVKCLSINHMRSLPQIKSISYLPSLLSHQKAVKKGYYDAILIDDKKQIYEGAYSNIFWFESNTLCTRKNNVLSGITRQAVLKISPFKIKYKTISIYQLYKKPEVFLTSSLKNIVPVTKIDNKKIGSGQPGKNTKILISMLSAHIHSLVG